MKSSFYILTGAVLIADLVLVGLSLKSPELAFLIHLVLCVVFFLVSILYLRQSRLRGKNTFLFFGSILCVLTPVIGFLALAALMSLLGRAEKPEHDHSPFIVGNPMRKTECIPIGLHPDSEFPAIKNLGRERYDEIVEDVAFLKSDYSNRSFGLFKRIRDRSNAMASLYANAALTVASNHAEEALSKARKRSQTEGDSLTASFELGSAYKLNALSGGVTKEDKIRFLKLAAEQFSKYKNDLPCLVQWLECAIELRELELAKRLLKDLNHIDSNNAFSAPLQLEVIALGGDWNALKEFSFVRKGIPDSVKQFWKGAKTA